MKMNTSRRTKIVATLGPASNDVEIIKQLILSGLDAARINFSHGTYDSHRDTVEKLKQAREELNAPIPLILDTKGPEIRIKTFKKNKVYLKQGDIFTLTTEDVEGDESRVSITYKNLPNDLKRGSRILLDDGLIELKVKSLTDTEIECVVVNEGFLSSRKGINVPDVYVNLPSLTEKDIEDIRFGIETGFDYIAASFIRQAADVLNIRKVLEENNGSHLDIIAKIESRDGVNNIDKILEVADGIMVARGDLGVEIPPEEVPHVQKMLILRSNRKGKPVITATQMLESMVMNPRPTRAEANDVANAIFDGSDAIMLSGETAQGKYPVESIKMMARIAEETESSINYYDQISRNHNDATTNITNAISYATCTTAAELDARCIATVTKSGFTARNVSKFRPSCPIVACTFDSNVWRKLNLQWGCFPILTVKPDDDEIFDLAVSKSLEEGITKNGDIIAIVAGIPVGFTGATNTLKVQVVGDVLLQGQGVCDKILSGNACIVKDIGDAEKYFKLGEIMVTPKTNDDLLPYIKKASALIVGTREPHEYSHTKTVAKTLDIPAIICNNDEVIDLITNGLLVTVDSVKGFVYNGIPDSN